MFAKKTCPETLDSFLKVRGKYPKCVRAVGHDGPHQDPAAGYEWQISEPGHMDFVRPMNTDG